MLIMKHLNMFYIYKAAIKFNYYMNIRFLLHIFVIET